VFTDKTSKGQMHRRVAITGIGILCPLGNDLSEVWSATMAGRSAIAARTFTNAATSGQLTVPVAGVSDSVLSPLPKATELMCDKFGRLALMAAGAAIRDARLDLAQEDRSRIGASTGTCMGGISETEVGFDTLYLRKRAKVHPFTVVRTMYNSPAAFICIDYQLSGPALSYSTTCSSSSVAIGEAARQIRHGYADVIIAGGSETLLTYSAVNCWFSAQLLAPLHDEPARSCRPFDVSRNGTVLGEGAVFLVLEEWDRAVARGARIYAELAGYACTADANHATQPSIQGQALSMQRALADAAIVAETVGYINAHGTATKLNDATETKAIKSVFGSHAHKLGISSSKSMVGHMVGAAGAFGIAMCAQAIATQHIPPTANLSAPDPECDLDYVPNTGRPAHSLTAALCNAFGFGGTAATVVVTAPH
jgi:3-oxoacyl-[acyl-carrier-protein] synthase II